MSRSLPRSSGKQGLHSPLSRHCRPPPRWRAPNTHLVDRNNRLRVLHSRQVLNRARNPHRDIQLGRDDFARLPDLERVVRIARVDGGAGSTDRGAEGVREGDDGRVERVLGFDAAAARDDDRSGREVGSLGFDNLFRNPLRLLCPSERSRLNQHTACSLCSVSFFRPCGCAASMATGRRTRSDVLGLLDVHRRLLVTLLCRLPRRSTNRKELDVVLGPDGRDGVAGVHRAGERVGRRDGHDVRDLEREQMTRLYQPLLPVEIEISPGGLMVPR